MMDPDALEIGDAPHSPQDNTQSLQAVVLECERKWHRIKSIQTQLGQTSVSLAEDLHGNEPSQSDSLSLLKERKKRLEAELTSLKESELQTLPENADMQRLLLLDQDHQENLQQLNETLAFMRAKRSELRESITEEKDLGKQQKELNTSLKERLAQVNGRIQSEGDSSSPELILADLQGEVENMSALDKTNKKTLIKLLNEHFPLSEEKEKYKSSKAALNDTQPFNVNDLCPLRSIIGKLVEQTLNSPADPYIDINETMWPPHIEFLLRSQIVRKHPQNSMQIRLNPFHL